MWTVTICRPRQGIVYELEWVCRVGTQGVGTKPILKVVVGFTTMMAFEAGLTLMSHLSTGSSVGTDHRNQTRNHRQREQRSVVSSIVPQEYRPVTSQAHTWTTIMIRKPSALESLSRNLRPFLPINMPGSGAPQSHHRRRLSFGEHVQDRCARGRGRCMQEPQLDDREPITWAA
ncbi:hypothetical protein K439DRAFT_1618488 [Ramaria rubella]|nr:hypothetical protein K439DRAFT_1618488 [Ramaria rubella]